MRKLVLTAVITTIIFSCKKDDDNKNTEPIQPVYPGISEFMPLEIGNYWVYEHVRVDTDGVETKLSMMDSIIVTGDTIIRGKKFMILEGTNWPHHVSKWSVVARLRDSSGYLVNSYGQIQLSVNNFIDTLGSSSQPLPGKNAFYTNTSKMKWNPKFISVPAGKFGVINYQSTIAINDSSYKGENPRYLDHYYGKGVGKVLQTNFYFSSPMYIEKRLVRYYVQ